MDIFHRWTFSPFQYLKLLLHCFMACIVLTRSLLSLFLCMNYVVFFLWLLLRLSTLSLVLVMMYLGVFFACLFLLSVYGSSLDRSVDDFHPGWEILGHFVLLCCPPPPHFGTPVLSGLTHWCCSVVCLFVFKFLLSVLHFGSFLLVCLQVH